MRSGRIQMIDSAAWSILYLGPIGKKQDENLRSGQANGKRCKESIGQMIDIDSLLLYYYKEANEDTIK